MINPNISADRIALCSLSKYRNLPKTGKPKSTEWTVLSCILQHRASKDQLEVVALGTGTKCLSQDLISMSGDRLNDSHAEVIARRAFIRYILDQLGKRDLPEEQDVAGEEPVQVFEFDRKTNEFCIAKDVSFHFFTTHAPCGDGSIFEEIHTHEESKKSKLEATYDIQEFGTAILKDGFTGGKMIDADGSSDLMAQILGAVRTKPGRGIRTLSVSCSDKLSRWSFAGIQGALLMTVLSRPIYLESATVCGACNTDAIERAIWKRWQDTPVTSALFQLHQPVVMRSSSHMVFESEKSELLLPAPSSIVWCKIRNGEREMEVAVSGKRQGVTKKSLSTTAGRLLISKVELLRKYLELVVTSYPIIGQVHDLKTTSTYASAKAVSTDYNDFCKQLKSDCFRCWTHKPEKIHNFYCLQFCAYFQF